MPSLNISDAFQEIKKIQGDNSLISLTHIFNDVEEFPGKYPTIEQIIRDNSARTARQSISRILRTLNYTCWNAHSGYKCKAVWRAPQ